MKESNGRRRAWERIAQACSVSVLVGGLVPAARAVEGVIPRATPYGAEDLLDSVFNIGPFKIRPHATAAVAYDDNIQLTQYDAEDDIVWVIAPGITIGAGDFETGTGRFVTLDYTPSIYLYTDHSGDNSADQLFTFAGQQTWTKLSVGLTQSYQKNAQGFVESASRVDRAFNITTLTSHYNFSERTSAEVNFRQTVANYEQLDVQGYNEWVNQNWVNYGVSEKVTVGGGATFAWRDVRPGPNETLQQVLVRAGYKVTEKVDVTGSAGVEFRQFQGLPSDDPGFVFSLGGVWRVRRRTELSLEAFRQDQSSVVSVGQNYTATGVRTAVRQALWQKWTASLAGGYQYSVYRDVGGGPTGRIDNYWFLGPEMDYTLNEQWSFGLFYRFRQNISNTDGFNFKNNQVGLRSSFRF